MYRTRQMMLGSLGALGLALSLGTASAQKEALTIEQLRAIVRETMARDGPLGLRDRALVLVGFAGAPLGACRAHRRGRCRGVYGGRCARPPAWSASPATNRRRDGRRRSPRAGGPRCRLRGRGASGPRDTA